MGGSEVVLWIILCLFGGDPSFGSLIQNQYRYLVVIGIGKVITFYIMNLLRPREGRCSAQEDVGFDDCYLFSLEECSESAI
jgi:hypothetical protein